MCYKYEHFNHSKKEKKPCRLEKCNKYLSHLKRILATWNSVAMCKWRRASYGRRPTRIWERSLVCKNEAQNSFAVYFKIKRAMQHFCSCHSKTAQNDTCYLVNNAITFQLIITQLKFAPRLAVACSNASWLTVGVVCPYYLCTIPIGCLIS